MLNLETALLTALLDRYERSRGFKENRSQQRRIQLQMYGGSKTDFLPMILRTVRLERPSTRRQRSWQRRA